jgi:GDPmannose 4,6-dehydratase
VKTAFEEVDIDIIFENSGINEIGINRKNGKKTLEIDKNFFRPTEVDLLKGDYSKANKILGWVPETKFKNLVKDMVNHDIFLNS